MAHNNNNNNVIFMTAEGVHDARSEPIVGFIILSRIGTIILFSNWYGNRIKSYILTVNV